jgi:hypothetical protein
MALSAPERTLRARLAAYEKWATHDPKGGTAAARAAFRARFASEVDPDGVLDPAERARRAESAFRAHMTRLAFKSAKARRTRAADELERQVSEGGGS